MCRRGAGSEEMQRLVVEVERLDGGAEGIGSGARDGVALFAYASWKGARQGVAQQAPYLRSIAREQCRAQTVEIVEHHAPMIGPNEHIATNVPCARVALYPLGDAGASTR